MANSTITTRFRLWLWLIALVGVIVPRRLRGVRGLLSAGATRDES
jgi:hypothetical protein